jgi:hypothetical protein
MPYQAIGRPIISGDGRSVIFSQIDPETKRPRLYVSALARSFTLGTPRPWLEGVEGIMTDTGVSYILTSNNLLVSTDGDMTRRLAPHSGELQGSSSWMSYQ